MGPSTIWLIVLVVLIAGEAATVGLMFIWFAIGVWSARSQSDVVIPVGTEVKVLRIEGVKVFVEAL